MKNTVVKGYGKRRERRFFRREEEKKMIISNQDKQDSKESILDKFVASVLGGLFFVLDKLGIR